MIYEPAEDSFLLEKTLKKYVFGKDVLDMGAGSGILSKSAISNGAKSVISADINSEAIENLKLQGIKAIKSNLFSKIKKKFDLIIFNPPYLPEDSREDNESKIITTGGKEGDELIVEFLNQSIKFLNPHGKILLLISSLTPVERITNKIKELGLYQKIIESKKVFFEKLEVWEIGLNHSNQ